MKSRPVRSYEFGWRVTAIIVDDHVYELAQSGHPKDPALNHRAKHRRLFPGRSSIPTHIPIALPAPDFQSAQLPAASPFSDINEDDEFIRMASLMDDILYNAGSSDIGEIPDRN
jgi:hypothetical protein